MKYFITLLLASFVAAAPAVSGKSRLERRVARRGGSQPLHKVAPSSLSPDTSPSKTHEQYSSNWAGVVIENPPSGTFTAVSATFQVPQPTSTGGSDQQSASAWVGIDGDTCGSAILQTGVDFTVNPDNSYSFSSWYEWFPDYAYDFSGISFNVGDTVELSVQSTSSTSGSATIKNLSNGQTVTQQINSNSALCGQNAEWIVEDFEQGNNLVPFANFNSVTFSNSVASTSDGNTVSSSIGGLIDIQQSGTTYTSSSQNGNSVTVNYV